MGMHPGSCLTRVCPMALKKPQIYSSLWQSCDELRGGMDASQYKDYVLTLLFMHAAVHEVRLRPAREQGRCAD